MIAPNFALCPVKIILTGAAISPEIVQPRSSLHFPEARRKDDSRRASHLSNKQKEKKRTHESKQSRDKVFALDPPTHCARLTWECISAIVRAHWNWPSAPPRRGICGGRRTLPQVVFSRTYSGGDNDMMFIRTAARLALAPFHSREAPPKHISTFSCCTDCDCKRRLLSVFREHTHCLFFFRFQWANVGIAAADVCRGTLW